MLNWSMLRRTGSPGKTARALCRLPDVDDDFEERNRKSFEGGDSVKAYNLFRYAPNLEPKTAERRFFLGKPSERGNVNFAFFCCHEDYYINMEMGNYCFLLKHYG